MGHPTGIETIKVEGGQLVEHVKQLVHEGNVRKITIKYGDRTVVEMPLTLGVVGAAIAPELAIAGALAALFTDCTIEVERIMEMPVSTRETGEPMAARPEETVEEAQEIATH